MKTSMFESGSEGKNNDGIVNVTTQTGVRLSRRDGTYEDFLDDVSISAPDENGSWKQTNFKNIHFDTQGNPLPSDMKGVAESHSRRLTPPNRIAVCSSIFHPHGLTRNIYIDVDGSVTEQGAICSACMRRRTVFNIAVVALGICLLIGFVKGLWF
jgi:hypothetical protein